MTSSSPHLIYLSGNDIISYACYALPVHQIFN